MSAFVVIQRPPSKSTFICNGTSILTITILLYLSLHNEGDLITFTILIIMFLPIFNENDW